MAAALIILAIGAIMLFHNAPAPYHTSVPLVAAVAGSLGAFWAIAIGKAIQVRRRPVAVGPQEIVGMEGVVRDGGLVFVRGELWRVRADEPLAPGQRVRVASVDPGLVLDVEPLDPASVP